MAAPHGGDAEKELKVYGTAEIESSSPTLPDWYHNLVANPETIIEIGTEKFPGRARFAEGEERERLFNAQATRKTERLIAPVIFERIG
jgi:hypothetical protein